MNAANSSGLAIASPLRHWEGYRLAFIPADVSGPTEPKWLKALRGIEHDVQLTIHNVDEQIGVVDENTELFETLGQARAEAMAIRITLREARSVTHQNFGAVRERLRGQYDALVSHLKHALFLVTRLYEVAMCQASELYNSIEGSSFFARGSTPSQRRRG
jgi:hypothetical protein